MLLEGTRETRTLSSSFGQVGRPLHRFPAIKLNFDIKVMVAMVATPAQELLMHTALEQKHILVRVEMPLGGTLAVVPPSMFGLVN